MALSLNLYSKERGMSLMSSLNYLFDLTVTDRVIITYQRQTGKYAASVRLVGAGEGYSCYSTGENPQIALQRALESAQYPERWRKMRFGT